MEKFEENVLTGLKKCLANLETSLESCNCLGVAVSGGADSISLLFALKNILPKKIVLKVVTINHNIRPQEETCKDADYVESFCKSLNIECIRYEIERGLIENNSKKNKTGIEDSARKIRYEKFNDFILSNKIDFLCLAHNKNDQEETILMRLIQGSGDLSGIPCARERFIRPLLSITRLEIENYLSKNKIYFRIDSSNLENEFMRNRIRNILIPVLNSNFKGWKKGFDNLSEKNTRDNIALNYYFENSLQQIEYIEKDNFVTFNADSFFSLQNAIKDRILMKAVKVVGAQERISQAFLRRWASKKYSEQKKTESSVGIQFSIYNGLFTIRKKTKVATESGFFVILEEPRSFTINGKLFSVSKQNNGLCFFCEAKSITLNKLDFPVVFRSRQIGDEVQSVDGTMKSVSKVFDGWKTLSCKDNIPIIQKIGKTSQKIKGIWGSLYGFNDWIVLD